MYNAFKILCNILDLLHTTLKFYDGVTDRSLAFLKRHANRMMLPKYIAAKDI